MIKTIKVPVGAVGSILMTLFGITLRGLINQGDRESKEQVYGT